MLHNTRFFILIVLFLSACSTTRQGVKLGTNAHEAFLQEDYASALALYENYIAYHENDVTQIPDSVYRDAGLSAFYLDKQDKALDYLNVIRHTESANAPAQYALAILNREIDNLSREITALESYVETFPEGEKIEEMRQRLFETYVESSNFQKALELWPTIETQGRESELLLNNYFTALQAQEKEEKLYSTALELLALNPDNTDALDYLARHYFHKAENRYQKEMEKYERNRTHRQYAQLLRAFDELNADFRKSLNYFLRLYEIDPRPAYARFIGNIYLRFDDKAKARYYHNKADN